MLYRPCFSSTVKRWGLHRAHFLWIDRWRRDVGPRHLSSQTDEVNVDVKVGSSGYITLNIRHPPRPSVHNPVIIYLPRGPLATPKASPLPPLRLGSNATVVQLNYRLSTDRPYPTPVHDVLAGYDWIKGYLAQSVAISEKGSQLPTLRKLGVCGEFVGGSLACMLALTECHLGEPGINAAVFGNPVTDWTAFISEDEETTLDSAKLAGSANLNRPNKSSTITDLLTTKSLLSLRRSIFPDPEKYHDAFASPALFFRTPTVELPGKPLFNIPPRGVPKKTPSVIARPPSLVKKRRSYRKYPPTNSNLRIPQLRFETGIDNVLYDQGLDMVELLRRSVRLWEGQGWTCQDGERRIQCVERDGMGLWGEGELNEIGRWFADVLD